jgi:hypothetical protein
MRAPIARCSVARIYNCEAREESSRTASVGPGADPGKSERSGGRAARHAQTDPATLAPMRDPSRYTRPPGAPGGSLAAPTLRTAPRRPGRPPDTRSGAAGGRERCPDQPRERDGQGAEQGHSRQDRPQRVHHRLLLSPGAQCVQRKVHGPPERPLAQLHPSAGSPVPTPVPCKDAAEFPPRLGHQGHVLVDRSADAAPGLLGPDRPRSTRAHPPEAAAFTIWPEVRVLTDSSSLRGRRPARRRTFTSGSSYA